MNSMSHTIISSASTSVYEEEDDESYQLDSNSMITSSRKRKHEEAITPWQRGYVENHVNQGHIGLCYAWLDLAYCPQQVLLSKCCYKHEYPSTWTEEMKSAHKKKLQLMSYLWKESSLEECFKKPKRNLEVTSFDSDDVSEYDGDNDSSSDDDSEYDETELELPIYSNQICLFPESRPTRHVIDNRSIE